MNPGSGAQGNWEGAKASADAAPQQPGVSTCPITQPKISVSWRDHDFQRVRKDTDNPPSHDLIITSTGDATLANIAVSVGGDQFKIEGAAAGSLAPNATTTVRVTFKPTSYGEKTATVTVKSNAVNEDPILLTVKGMPYSVITFILQEDTPEATKIENAKLKIKQEGEAEKEVTTDVNGKVEFETEKGEKFEVQLGDWENVLEFRSLTTA
jgi:hypothetical protein